MSEGIFPEKLFGWIRSGSTDSSSLINKHVVVRFPVHEIHFWGIAWAGLFPENHSPTFYSRFGQVRLD